MLIPEKLKILGLEWSVTRDQHVSDASYTHGTTVSIRQKINIEPDVTPAHAEQVFLHELIHAVWWQMGLTKLEYLNEKQEEQIVNALANGLYHALKVNNLLA